MTSTKETILKWGKDVLAQEADCLLAAKNLLGEEFFGAVETLRTCEGKVIVSGMGKKWPCW